MQLTYLLSLSNASDISELFLHKVIRFLPGQGKSETRLLHFSRTRTNTGVIKTAGSSALAEYPRELTKMGALVS